MFVLACLSGCATLSKPETYADCAAADTASTYLAIKAGAVEANPLMASIIAQGWIPFVMVQVGIAMLVFELDEPKVTAPVSALKCGVAVNNLLLL